jgi:DNA-binding transcriptional regulator YhcF (GntR family)
MKPPLTPHQRFLLARIREFQFGNRCSPTLRQLAEMIGVKSINGVRKTLLKLEKLGVVELNHRGTILFPREALDGDFFAAQFASRQ